MATKTNDKNKWYERMLSPAPLILSQIEMFMDTYERQNQTGSPMVLNTKNKNETQLDTNYSNTGKWPTF